MLSPVIGSHPWRVSSPVGVGVGATLGCRIGADDPVAGGHVQHAQIAKNAITPRTTTRSAMSELLVVVVEVRVVPWARRARGPRRAGPTSATATVARLDRRAGQTVGRPGRNGRAHARGPAPAARPRVAARARRRRSAVPCAPVTAPLRSRRGGTRAGSVRRPARTSSHADRAGRRARVSSERDELVDRRARGRLFRDPVQTGDLVGAARRGPSAAARAHDDLAHDQADHEQDHGGLDVVGAVDRSSRGTGCVRKKSNEIAETTAADAPAPRPPTAAASTTTSTKTSARLAVSTSSRRGTSTAATAIGASPPIT